MQDIDPLAAYTYLKARTEAVLVDCRTEIEFLYVGHPVGAEHIAWQEAPDWEIDPDFADKVKQLVAGDLTRSVDAGEALEAAGFASVINVTEGFEGPLDDNYHRGTLGGWRCHGLPWQQN
jgi:rhodanese-related sulfurtransferase